MAQDQQTYRRAAVAALVGLAMQLVVAVAMALIGLYTQSPAAHAATWHLFGGLPIWLILWVLFQQHRLERQESLETEQLSQGDARTKALFEDSGENLRVARRRLELLDKWWLPIVSLAVALYLVAVGSTLAYLNYQGWQNGTLRANPVGDRALQNAAIVAVLLLAIAFVTFLVARYVSGMTKVREWTLLRGGAAYLMGSAVLGLLLAAGLGIVGAGGGTGTIAALAVVIPILTALLGAEILLGFVFGLYRPRRPGEISRPAFDSRTLGLLTRPESIGKTINETINYQFGFEVSASWFYRLLARAVTPLLIVGAVVLIGMTSIVVVRPQEQAVITTSGAFDRVVEPGLHFKYPWPIGRVQRFDVYRVHQVVVGSEGGETKQGVAILWTNQHTENKEDYLVTAPARFDREAEEGGNDSDTVAVELVGARVVVKYRIKKDGLKDYAQSVADPVQLLRSIASRRVNTYLVTHTIDDLLTQGRVRAGEELTEQLAEDLDSLDRPLGIEIVFVGFEAIHPPQDSEVAAKFHEQIDARQQKQSTIEDAQRKAITTLAEVAGSRERALEIAKAISDLDGMRHQLQQASRPEGGDAARAAELNERIAQQEAQIERLMDEAGGKAAQMIHEARGYRWQFALDARGRALRLEAQRDAFAAAPDYFQRRMFLEAIAEGMKDARKTVIVKEPGGTVDIRLNNETEGNDLGGIFGDQP